MRSGSFFGRAMIRRREWKSEYGKVQVSQACRHCRAHRLRRLGGDGRVLVGRQRRRTRTSRRSRREAAEQPKAALRTVAVVTPPRIMHARAIRISGQTEADKRAVLATRVDGRHREPARQAGRARQDRRSRACCSAPEDKKPRSTRPSSVLAQRKAEARCSRTAGQGRQRAQAAARHGARRRWRRPSRSWKRPRPNSTATRSGRHSTASSTGCRCELGSSIMAGARGGDASSPSIR